MKILLFDHLPSTTAALPYDQFQWSQISGALVYVCVHDYACRYIPVLLCACTTTHADIHLSFCYSEDSVNKNIRAPPRPLNVLPPRWLSKWFFLLWWSLAVPGMAPQCVTALLCIRWKWPSYFLVCSVYILMLFTDGIFYKYSYSACYWKAPKSALLTSSLK